VEGGPICREILGDYRSHNLCGWCITRWRKYEDREGLAISFEEFTKDNFGTGWERDKELILADYYSNMLFEHLFKKWHITKNDWKRLRVVWGVKLRGSGRHRKGW